jgi:hypothetical protein
LALTNVGLTPSRVVQEGDGPGVLINRDIASQVIIGRDNGIFGSNPNSYSILDPLVGIPVSGEADIWAATLTATSVVVDFMPSASGWTPSPAQQAEQLSALGLALNTTVQSTNTALTSGIALPVGAAKDATVSAVPGGIATTGVPLLTL